MAKAKGKAGKPSPLGSAGNMLADSLLQGQPGRRHQGRMMEIHHSWILFWPRAGILIATSPSQGGLGLMGSGLGKSPPLHMVLAALLASVDPSSCWTLGRRAHVFIL